MTVQYTGVEAQIINLAAVILSGSTTFQTLVGEATAVAARTHIVEIDDQPPVGAHAAIAIPEIDWDRVSMNHVLGTATVGVVVLFPPTGGLTEPETFRDALNISSAISLEMNTIATSDGYELVQSIMPTPIVKLDQSEELAGWFSLQLTVSMLCMP